MSIYLERKYGVLIWRSKKMPWSIFKSKNDISPTDWQCRRCGHIHGDAVMGYYCDTGRYRGTWKCDNCKGKPTSDTPDHVRQSWKKPSNTSRPWISHYAPGEPVPPYPLFYNRAITDNLRMSMQDAFTQSSSSATRILPSPLLHGQTFRYQPGMLNK